MSQDCNITLGLCVKNAAQTIGFAIDSVVKQDFPHECMKLIVVDGYSDDNTSSIIKKKLVGSHIKTVFFSENTGLGFARQTVVNNAWGEYIIWIDGDVILAKDHVRQQVDFMNTHPSAAIGRARYGILTDAGPIAFLENIPFVVESSKASAEVPLGICGTEGAIFRVKAVREVGGFDVGIQGAAEDTDLSIRMLSSGWKAYVTNAVFYEVCKESWSTLWNQYFWWGQGWHYYFHKNRKLIELVKMSPLGGFISGLLRLPFAYKLSRRKVLILLPFHYAFKRFAFCYGVSKAHLAGYGH